MGTCQPNLSGSVSAIGVQSRESKESPVQAESESERNIKGQGGQELSDTLPGYLGACWEVGAEGLDYRPHLYDPVMK